MEIRTLMKYLWPLTVDVKYHVIPHRDYGADGV